MTTGVLVFTRDLRVHDQPALAAAMRKHSKIVPLFVFDDAVASANFRPANRAAFLLDSLADLDVSLQSRGAKLAVRNGNWADEVLAVAKECGASAIHLTEDVSGFASRRLAELRALIGSLEIQVVTHPGVMVISPGAVLPTGGDHYKVFTPYYRKWLAVPWRSVLRAPKEINAFDEMDPGSLPSIDEISPGPLSPNRTTGGEGIARQVFTAWRKSHLYEYEAIHNDLPANATSHLAPYLHFGCLSPLEVATSSQARDGAEAWVRQLCWRDFYHQALAARPDASWADFKHRGDHWIDDPDALNAWKEGRTGFPVVDAGMRQLLDEGFMHNRTRMIVASFLTKDLGIDWRHGARHFLEWLTDGDIANNNLNWQWTAGTGTDTNPNRIFNPTVQGQRFDPKGEYVRRYVNELASIPDGSIHTLGPLERAALGYPLPLVDHHEAIAEYRARRGH